MMEEDQSSGLPDQSMPPLRLTAGQCLCEQRQALGYSVEQVADGLKLYARQIEALEADDYTGMQQLYVHGYLRAYARFLQLDPNQVVAVAPAVPVIARHEGVSCPLPFQSVSGSSVARRRWYHPRLSKKWMLILFAVIVVVLLVNVGFVRHRQSSFQLVIPQDAHVNTVNQPTKERRRVKQVTHIATEHERKEH